MEYPTGTVTFLFTDIESSTKLAQDHPDQWEDWRHRHHAILYSAIERSNGFIFQIIGDAFCAAFHTAGDALRAAVIAQQGLVAGKWGQAAIKVRMGIHTGKAEIQGGSEYQGYLTMSWVQRVMSVAYGGQILLSNATCELIRGELPEGTSLLDMQEHRLKGLLNPEHLWQVFSAGLQKEFPPLQSLNDIPNNLPIKLTTFIGRENEITELKNELKEHLLVTLTGSGGTGKTRLSLQVAAEVLDSFPQGVWFLELAPVTDPALVPNTLANLLGLRESEDTKQSVEELICGYLRSRKVLLVFDNCEHLIDACARLVDQLLRACKDLRILASSREALGVEGEMAWHVPSLSMPDIKKLPAIEQLSQYEAVRLFIERAVLVQPHFSLTNENAPAVAQICARLDGIPLAIELAAARANVLTVEQITKRLDDRFRLLTGGARTALPRQQTLRAMIDWSYNLLSQEESLLFRRLAVFVGGWTLEAAESVCGGSGLDPMQILDLLSQLVKKSLVNMEDVNGESRYRRLETIRQYAREKLFETEEAAHIRDAHLDYFIEFAEQGFLELLGRNDLVWIEKLENENDNLRSALSWSLESPGVDPQKALQMSGALQDFWDIRGYITEGWQWISAALKKAPEVPTTQRCRALIGAGLFSIRLSRDKESLKYAQESLALARQLDHAPFTIISLFDTANLMPDFSESSKRFKESIALARVTPPPNYLAFILSSGAVGLAKDFSETMAFIKEAYHIAEEQGNTRQLAWVLWEYGGIEMRSGNYVSATTLLQKGLQLSRLLKDKHTTAHILLMKGRIASRQSSFEEAFQYDCESLQVFRDLSDRICSANALFHIGWNAYVAGWLEQAVEYLEKCRSLSLELTGNMIVISTFALGRIAIERGDIPAAKGFYQEALEGFSNVEDSLYYFAYFLEAISAIPTLPPETSARFLGRARTIREEKSFVLPVSERHLVDPLIEALVSKIGREAFESSLAGGMALTNKEVVVEVREVLQGLG